jgi:uroporphyrinogen decarboxylase
MPLQNNRFIRALLRQNVDKTPVWIMRQAGRYLPEYRATREKVRDFMTLCKTPELACEVTLQPLARFDLDAAILFSDILTIPDAMGLGLHFIEGEGPHFTHPLRTAADIARLGAPDPEHELRYVNDAVKLIKHELQQRLPLIGFSGSPWTLACYMVEGGSSKDFSRVKQLMYNDPKAMHALLATLAKSVSLYLQAQIQAGVDAVMLFDTWGGILTDRDYRQFSLAYMQQIIERLPREREGQRIPIILFTKNGALWLDAISKTGCDAIGLDWSIDIGRAREQVGHRVALQGNMDPAILKSSSERISEEVGVILKSFGHGEGHVFNLGHGITPDVPPENVTVMVDAVHELSKAYHSEN